MKNLHTILLLVISIAFSAIFIACSDSSSEGQPEITGVRLIEPEYADSLFTEAVAGQSIVIVGRNLSSTREIYINDQQVSFNITYVTDTHIILTIPSEIVLTGVDPSLRNEIRVVTNEGQATFDFHINAGWCQIYSMKAKYPLKSGDEILFVGENFIDIESITYVDKLEDETPEEELEWWEIADQAKRVPAPDYATVTIPITDYSVSNAGKELRIKLPEGMLEFGWLVIKTHTNTQTTMIFKDAEESHITGISSDMPVVGAPVKIYGSGFVGVMSVTIGNNEIVIPQSKLTISEDHDVIEFILPSVPAKGGTLTLTNVVGSTTIPFYDTNLLMFDLDDRGILNWGGASVVAGDGVNPPYVTSGNCAGVNADIQGPNYWWYEGRMGLKEMIIPESFIPKDTPVGNIELRFEGYFRTKFEYTNVEVSFGENGIYATYTPQSVENEGIIMNQWATYKIPLPVVAGDAQTWGEVVKNIAWPELVIHAVSNPTDNLEHIEFYLDNLRVFVK